MVIRTTGFMKGLYSDSELKSDNVKDKDAKIGFLQKAIDVLVLVSGEPLSAKPARIVAGHEPERTNELLQMLGRCCLSKLPSEDAVRRVLAGERGDWKGRAAKSQETDNKGLKDGAPRPHKDKEERRNSGTEESPGPEQRPPAEPREERPPRDKERARPREPPEKESRGRARPERERAHRDRTVERPQRDKERARERDRDRDRDRRRARNGGPARDPMRDPNGEHSRPEKKSAGAGAGSKKPADGPLRDTKAEVETEVSQLQTTKASKRRSKTSGEGRKEGSVPSRAAEPALAACGPDSEAGQATAAPEGGAQDAHPPATSVSSDSAAMLWPESLLAGPAAKPKGDSASDAEREVGPADQEKSEVPENAEVPSELASSLRKTPRPASARPAPPRIKRQESSEVLAVDRVGSGRAPSHVITDSQLSDNEEDEQFVVEAAPQLSEVPEVEAVAAMDLDEDEKHGGLVKKILETKKDYEKAQPSPRAGEKEKSLVYESAWRKEKDIACKEMEKLRTSIQTLCRSALPLGKIMDYLQEDVDAMQNELQLWHSESRQHAEALQQEQRSAWGVGCTGGPAAGTEPPKPSAPEWPEHQEQAGDRLGRGHSLIVKKFPAVVQKQGVGLYRSSVDHKVEAVSVP
ncbi:TRAF3-interacting protein 1 [Echinops telfairi]|uniref:TRAF3-interacting protein 1 n=1 Tax=Echinops telfairi TaxID=9371 RepID=A0AC55DF72_ECHTE|nr:TRAF3-interacting protein 1 [Echinops telfairi]